MKKQKGHCREAGEGCVHISYDAEENYQGDQDIRDRDSRSMISAHRDREKGRDAERKIENITINF